MADLAKKFVTEDEVEDQKRKRQEEWEKVRRPDQPKEAPEEEYDPRCLYDRLQEQKMKKDDEFEESHKLKNQIRGLDEEETDFLGYVSDRQRDLQKAKMAEEEEVLNEYRNTVVGKTTAAKEPVKASVTEKKAPSRPVSTKSSQQKLLLAGAVKRKSPSDTDTTSATEDASKKAKTTDSAAVASAPSDAPSDLPSRVLVGRLPGLGSYGVGSSEESSDSNSSDSDDIDVNFFHKKQQCQN